MAEWVDVANQLKVLIQPISGMPTVYVKKIGTVQHDELPACVISFGVENYDSMATFGAGGTRGSVGKEWGIVISLYEKSMAAINTGLTINTNLFETIIRTIDVTSLTGVTGQWDSRVETNEAWKQVPFGRGYQESALIYWAKVIEERN